MSKVSLIKRAINNKNLIKFWYNDRIRKVEPHIYGIKNQTYQILAYQLEGGSKSSTASLPEWRRFDLDKMSEVKVLEERFSGPRQTETSLRSEWDELLLIVS